MNVTGLIARRTAECGEWLPLQPYRHCLPEPARSLCSSLKWWQEARAFGYGGVSKAEWAPIRRQLVNHVWAITEFSRQLNRLNQPKRGGAR